MAKRRAKKRARRGKGENRTYQSRKGTWKLTKIASKIRPSRRRKKSSKPRKRRKSSKRRSRR